MDKLLNTNEVAQFLNVKPITIRRKAATGEIPAVKFGNRYRFDKSQIDRWLVHKDKENPMQILVIDDEPLIGQLFGTSLGEHSYQLTTTLSSLEALELFKTRHFDLIFLDLLMPELDGAELFRQIRQMDGKTPVVIITGYPDSDTMSRAMKYGPITVLKKPFYSEQIHDVIQSLDMGY